MDKLHEVGILVSSLLHRAFFALKNRVGEHYLVASIVLLRGVFLGGTKNPEMLS